MSVGINTIIIDLINESRYLVLWISMDGSYGYWFSLTDKTDIPLKFIMADVNASISDGNCEIDMFATQLHPEDALSITEREYRDRRWRYIEEVVKQVYHYFVSKGIEIIDDIDAFDGVHGVFTHKRADGSEFVKVGYHEGLVDSRTWLAVQDRKSQHKTNPRNTGAKNSWLVGLVKCTVCGYGVHIYAYWDRKRTYRWRYYGCDGEFKINPCTIGKSRLNIKPHEVEQAVFDAMKERIDNLIIAKTEKEQPDKESDNIKVEVIRLEDEIRGLMDKLSKADETLFSYIQDRVKILHDKKSGLEERLRAKARKHKEIDTAPLSEPLSRWDELTIDEKHLLALTMINVVRVSDETGIDIEFSF